MNKQIIFILFVAYIVTLACKHESFPPPPPGMNNDTIQDPIDSNSTKKCHPDTVYYTRDIQPLLNSNCAIPACHDAATAQSGVILTDYTNVRNTADVRPGDPTGSDLYEVLVEDNSNQRMPYLRDPLPAGQIELVRKWILQGARNLSCDECDTVDLTYNTDIKIVFQQNCISCHGSTNPPGGRSLTTYSEVQDALLNTNLLSRINGEPGVAVMPQGGKMPECNIDKIEIWFHNGMPQ